MTLCSLALDAIGATARPVTEKTAIWEEGAAAGTTTHQLDYVFGNRTYDPLDIWERSTAHSQSRVALSDAQRT
ncbi:hypothetical protein SD72_02860 [Leucobacter komagatae]|uniref:Uncharacterized protein n=1 Tax=Leucobacter komagatae TaxID=55969 RepID=A0A0D0IVH8_9MICO|nr:hypothetical protein SD72_02860 [Leucobacter komagatae]